MEAAQKGRRAMRPGVGSVLWGAEVVCREVDGVGANGTGVNCRQGRGEIERGGWGGKRKRKGGKWKGGKGRGGEGKGGKGRVVGLGAGVMGEGRRREVDREGWEGEGGTGMGSHHGIHPGTDTSVTS